jgi:hypothetical protein
LKGIDATERLEGWNIFTGMCSHRVRLASAVEVDEEVKEWLKQAFDRA